MDWKRISKIVQILNRHNTYKIGLTKDKTGTQKEHNVKSSSGPIPWLVFLFSITITLISFVPVMFPAIVQSDDITTALSIPKVGPSQYETGIWAIPLVITNGIVFGLFAIYKKGKLPKNIENNLKKIFSFEISKKVAFIVLVVLIGIYVTASVNELSAEEKWEDYDGVKKRVDSWNISQISNIGEPHVNYFFLKSSMILFGSYKVIPFLASISLLVMTYFITKKITQKRFAGVISVLVILQSSLFLTYDTSVAYTNFWVLFYLLSLYLVYKFWHLSPVLYLVSIPAKALTAMFLPMSIYFILRSSVSKKTKIVILSSTVAIIIAAGIATISGTDLTSGGSAEAESFNAKDFWMGFTSFSYQLRFDGLVILFMIPLILGLFILSKKDVRHAESIMVLISGMLLIAPILTGFTNQTNQPYRFMPLIVFFAIGVGVLLSKREPKIQV